MRKKPGVSKLAIMGGSASVKTAGPAWPVSGDFETSRMEDVVRSGKWSWVGPHESAFCREYARFIGSKHCLLLANGTVTIQCALQAVGVKPGDEVLIPGITWVATLQAVLDVGANAVVVDVDPESYCICPKSLEAAITPKTRAIVPVHLYGCMCDMDAVMDIARRNNLKVVEDTAHQHGSKWEDTCAGAIGDAGSFSFQQSKPLTSGEGGAVTCNSDEVYEKVFALKHVGWAPDLATPGNLYGHNYRATEMQAVLLRGGLKRLSNQLRRREENVSLLSEGFARAGGPLRAAKRDPRVTRQAYYGMTLHYDSEKAFSVKREHYLAALAAEGFNLQVPYPPVYRHPLLNLYDSTSPVPFRNRKAMQDYKKLELPVTERVAEEEGVMFGHRWLLGSQSYMNQLLDGLKKVNDNLRELKKYAEGQERAQHAETACVTSKE